jgi:hypothetical protein
MFRSPIILWSVFTLSITLTVIWCLVDVKPYPGMFRDWLIGTVAFGGTAAMSFVLALRSRQKR